jgi:hypothetical protein
MQSIFSNALSEAVAKHIDLSATRRETLSWLALLIMQHGTISLWRLAAYVASAARIDSVRRRFYRFFQFVRLDSTLAARVVVDLLRLSGKPWVLAIDRTNWDFGKTTINILMISVTWNGMGIPLLWMLLPTAGNSHTSERTALLDRLRAAFPDLKIAALMGDREFIGDAWMAYLQRENIPFILRLRENQFVLRAGAARRDAARLRRTPGARLFRPSAPCAGTLSATMDDRDHVRQSQDQRLRPRSHASHRSGQTLDLARAHGFRGGAHRQDRRRHGAPASHSAQKTRPPSLVAVRSRPQHAPQNLRRRKSRSNNRIPQSTPVSKTPHQTPPFFGFPIGSRVLWPRTQDEQHPEG